MAKGPAPKARPATAGLILVCTLAFVVVYVLSILRADGRAWAAVEALWMLGDVELLERAGGLVGARVWLDAQWWRTLSAALLHGSWLHLVLNCWGLWVVGAWTERVWGPWRQLALCAWASLGGALASLAWAEAPLVVGASGGIFGLAGALVVVRRFGSSAQQKQVEPVSAKVLSFWLIFWLVVGGLLPVLGVEVLAQAGHMGGLAFGCLLGGLWSLDPGRRGARWAMRLGAVAAVTALSVAAWRPSWRANYHLFVGIDHFTRGDYEAGLPELDVALADAPENASLHNYVAYTLAEEGLELERAQGLVEVALESEPDNADYLDTLGWILCKRGDVEGGMEVLRAAEAAATREIPEIGEHLEGCAEAG